MNNKKMVCLLLSSFIFYSSEAQIKDSVPARHLAEIGSKGDIILGNEYKKSQLTISSRVKSVNDPAIKQDTPKSKK